MYSWMIYINGDLVIFLLIFAHYYIYLFQLGIENGGREFEKRALQRVKNYEKGQYSYFHLLNIKNVFQHYIFSSLHQIQCIYIRGRRNRWPVASIFTVGPVKLNKDRSAGPVDILGPLGPATFISSVSFNID